MSGRCSLTPRHRIPAHLPVFLLDIWHAEPAWVNPLALQVSANRGLGEVENKSGSSPAGLGAAAGCWHPWGALLGVCDVEPV